MNQIVREPDARAKATTPSWNIALFSLQILLCAHSCPEKKIVIPGPLEYRETIRVESKEKGGASSEHGFLRGPRLIRKDTEYSTYKEVQGEGLCEGLELCHVWAVTSEILYKENTRPNRSTCDGIRSKSTEESFHRTAVPSIEDRSQSQSQSQSQSRGLSKPKSFFQGWSLIDIGREALTRDTYS